MDKTHVKTFLGMDITLMHPPELEPEFIPLDGLFRAHGEKAAGRGKAGLAVWRASHDFNVVLFDVEDADNPTDADKFIANRLLKSMLWMYGGYKVTVAGSTALYDYISSVYCKGGERGFDREFMSGIYEKPFEVVCTDIAGLPAEPVRTKGTGGFSSRKVNGCRLGFDAGGSDLKISAVIDGEAVFSEEIVWQPKVNSDPAYHYKYIVDTMKLGASKMPRIDCIGVSSAGIYVDNRTMAASLFIKVPEDAFGESVKDIYIRAAKEIGDIPLVVANDGDVTALAGAMEYNDCEVLGIAMGTSEAGGYIDSSGGITGWLNELAFVPVDANPGAMSDEWSGDTGCGVKYFSQDAVIKLALKAGINIDETLTPAEKLLIVQGLMKQGDERAKKIYGSIGAYLGYTLAYYSRFYKLRHVLLLGRVMSGEGGAVILEKTREVLESEYPALFNTVKLHLPDEKERRVGQSIAAASLPELRQQQG